MPTQLLFRDDAYLHSCEATVVAINERNGILLDRTVFYATGGGQPGDGAGQWFDFAVTGTDTDLPK